MWNLLGDLNVRYIAGNECEKMGEKGDNADKYIEDNSGKDNLGDMVENQQRRVVRRPWEEKREKRRIGFVFVRKVVAVFDVVVQVEFLNYQFVIEGVIVLERL